MARIAGVDIPKDKKVAYSLRYVHGIGLNTAMRVCELAKVDPEVRVTDLSSKDEDAIRKVIVDLKLLIEGELRSENLKNVKTLIMTTILPPPSRKDFKFEKNTKNLIKKGKKELSRFLRNKGLQWKNFYLWSFLFFS